MFPNTFQNQYRPFNPIQRLKNNQIDIENILAGYRDLTYWSKVNCGLTITVIFGVAMDLFKQFMIVKNNAYPLSVVRK